MASAYSFRTAFNGFNREDVVHYLEYINTKNANRVAQLESELDNARKEVSRLQDLEDLQQRCQTLEQEKADLLQELAQLRQQQEQRSNEAELEAYRRAERMERQARQRTQQLFQQANGILADASAKVDTAAEQIGGMADQVASQLLVLQQAVVGSKAALQEAAAAMYTIRPEEEQA